MRLFKFIFKSLTTVIIGIVLGWYMANNNLPITIKKEFINPIIKSSKIYYVTDRFYNK